MATFDQLKTGDLFVCTDSNGVTYKVTWDKIEDIVLPPVGVWHIKDISGGYVNITDYDRIEMMDGTNLDLDGSPYRPTSGEYLVYGDLARFKESTGNWNFGPQTDTEYVVNFGYLCQQSPKFNGNISYLNTRNGFDLSYMFQGCTAFNQPVTNIDTSKANTLRAMFKDTSFNQSVTHFNTSSAQSMTIMFSNCKNFNQPVDHFDTSNVTQMNSMFYKCPVFNQDLNSWDTSKVENMNKLFNKCSVFNGNISNWNTGNVKDMFYMFAEARNFNQDLSNWDVGNVTTMNSMFYLAQAFNQPIGSWNTKSAVDMNYIFYQASAFNQNISQWCVTNASHTQWNYQCPITSGNSPVWGTCPRGEDQTAAFGASTEPVYESYGDPDEPTS